MLIAGIGSSSGVFSFTGRILLRPLPYPNEHQLVSFGMTAPISGSNEFILEQNYASWVKQNTPFSGIAVTAGVNDCNLSEANPARLCCSRVSANYLSVLGYRPAAGRDFMRRRCTAWRSASGPLPLAAAVLSLTFAVLLAAWIPARRAARVQPVDSLCAL